MRVLVTGAAGFIGRNLVTRLREQDGYEILTVGRNDPWERVEKLLPTIDFVIHLAGVNRPHSEDEFISGNVGFTEKLCGAPALRKRKTPILFSSSIQAALDNPYGRSKRTAEKHLERYANDTGSQVVIYRLPNVFGKWCRPNYNSVVATFCYNIARDLPIVITDPDRQLELVYIDDVMEAIIDDLKQSPSDGVHHRKVPITYKITVAELAHVIRSFRASRQSLIVPDHSDPLLHKLYATYLSYLETDDFAYDLEQRVDARGALAEFIKSEQLGQVFVSRTKPGITRGNHYHHTKNEKFFVVEGEAIVRFRSVHGDHVIEYPVRGEDFRVIDIPPGYTHSIENVGDGELVTLFWASEIFDPARSDTYSLPVVEGENSNDNLINKAPGEEMLRK